MKTIKKTMLTNSCIGLIIAFVCFTSFGPLGQISGAPLLKGCTGGDNVALQIMVNDSSEVGAYMDTLERVGAQGTFFFCEQCGASEDLLSQVRQRGHGVGSYVCAAHKGKETDMYIGSGYSVPVMHYNDGQLIRRIGPSLDIARLKAQQGWLQTLEENLFGDMFIRVVADEAIGDFEKVVQIVSNKGYTMLRIDEML